MRAFVGQVDHAGLRRFIPEDLLPRGELIRLARPQPTTETVVWALLEERDAEALRAEVDAGRHRRACGLLLSWAVELIPLRAAAVATARPTPSRP